MKLDRALGGHWVQAWFILCYHKDLGIVNLAQVFHGVSKGVNAKGQAWKSLFVSWIYNF